MTGTEQQAIVYGFEWVDAPTPYELGGQGTKPGQPVDCSRLVQQLMAYVGIPFTRTTQTQWADPAFPHMPPNVTPQAGWPVYFKVVGDPGEPPQHVGLCISSTQMIEAPHTGEDVKVGPIPNTGSESIYGFIVPPYSTSVVLPPKGGDMIARNTAGQGYWAVRGVVPPGSGVVYAYDGAPDIGPNPAFIAQWGIATATNPIVGIVDDGQGGFVLEVDANQYPGQPALYHILSNGTYK